MCVLFFTRFRFLVRHLDFWQNGASDKVGTSTVGIHDPENIGVDTRIMFVSRRVPKLEGMQQCLMRAVRVTNRSAVLGKIAIVIIGINAFRVGQSW